MKTKTIFKTLALAMMMPAMLLTTACSSDDDSIINTANTENTINKGYALPVTVNVTRQGDATTRATYTDNGDDTGSLAFSSSDKLFVYGDVEGGAGNFAGTLNYVPATGNFSGTIYTKNSYEGTADALFTAASADGFVNATLLPAGYESYGYLYIRTYDDVYEYNDEAAQNNTYTLATSKAAGVEQFSYEKATGYSSSFALAPKNAILNFTITGLAASTDVAVSLTGSGYTITKTVTTDGSGNATFAAGVSGGKNLNDFSLTVGGNPITLVTESKTLTAGKIYNITRSAEDPNAPLPGIFSISAGQTVQFSKGNLQYQASTGTWRFAEYQWVYVGTLAGNNTSSGRNTQSGWIDLFGWGTSGKTFASGYGTAYQPWATSTTNNQYGPTDGNSGLTGTYADGDWGVNMGTGWRTLTSDEWTYLLDTRGGTRYCKATVNSKMGLVIFPDSYSHPAGVTAVASANTTDAAFNTNSWSEDDWTKMEAAGAVFLPEAGYRDGTSSVINVGSSGYYWSSTPDGANKAYRLSFSGRSVYPANSGNRSLGYSVRLVQGRSRDGSLIR